MAVVCQCLHRPSFKIGQPKVLSFVLIRVWLVSYQISWRGKNTGLPFHINEGSPFWLLGCLPQGFHKKHTAGSGDKVDSNSTFGETQSEVIAVANHISSWSDFMAWMTKTTMAFYSSFHQSNQRGFPYMSHTQNLEWHSHASRPSTQPCSISQHRLIWSQCTP